MEKRKSIILVTWDFTEKSEYALLHAINVSKVMDCVIKLVHIIKKSSERTKTEGMMKDEVKRLSDKYSVTTEYLVREGTIFSTISKIVFDEAASMVFMGTHGIKGMQKLLGSWALKVIAKSRSPFIVVQKPPNNDIYKKIVVPVNFKSENKENAKWIEYLYNNFKAKFILYKANNTDKRFVRGVNSNLLYAQKYMRAKEIEYEIATAEGKLDFAKETVAYAKAVDADMILIMTTRGLGFADYVLGAHEQFIIGNEEHIPVMVINPKPIRLTGGFRTAGG
ncbi:MAG: universal stress protein [Bacteroidetes bacterium]|jgi:nucleotide-binding universal stress UspA family protein|nr:universal stress protein [Bacteroidota bacterium]